MKRFSNEAAVIVGEIVEYSHAHQTVSPNMQKSAEPLGIVSSRASASGSRRRTYPTIGERGTGVFSTRQHFFWMCPELERGGQDTTGRRITSWIGRCQFNWHSNEVMSPFDAAVTQLSRLHQHPAGAKSSTLFCQRSAVLQHRFLLILGKLLVRRHLARTFSDNLQ